MLRISNIHPRLFREMSLSGLTLLNFSRTSAAGVTFVAVMIEMRASAGIWFRAMLQPIQPARRAVADNGGRLQITVGV
jgi:hypothetical protein